MYSRILTVAAGGLMRRGQEWLVSCTSTKTPLLWRRTEFLAVDDACNRRRRQNRWHTRRSSRPREHRNENYMYYFLASVMLASFSTCQVSRFLYFACLHFLARLGGPVQTLELWIWSGTRATEPRLTSELAENFLGFRDPAPGGLTV